MNRAEKAAFVDELSDRFGRFKGAILVNYQGLTVADLSELRRELRAVGGEFKVVKNRLCLRSLKSINMDAETTPFFHGPTGIVFGFSDPVSPAKVIQTFAKSKEKLTIKMGLLPGTVLSAAQVAELATLPSKEELIAKFLGLLMAVPTSFVRVLHAVPQKLVLVLEAVRQKKEKEVSN